MEKEDLEKLDKEQLILKVRELQQKLRLIKYKEEKIQKKKDKHQKKKNLNFNQYEICKIALKLSYDGKKYQVLFFKNKFNKKNKSIQLVQYHFFKNLIRDSLVRTM